jgi:two-component system nitrate/nitrite response regulator NarL
MLTRDAVGDIASQRCAGDLMDRLEPRLLPRRPDDGRMTIRVVMAIRVALYREGLEHALGALSRVSIVGVVASCGQLAAAIPEAVPDAILLDADYDEMIATARSLTARWPHLKLVGIGAFDDDLDVIACAEAGICGFVTPDDGIDRLLAAFESVAHDRVVCTPAIAAALLRRVREAAGSAQVVAPGRLTARELEVLRLIDAGLSNKEIADRLGIKLPTVKNHVHNILGKLEVGRRSEAVFHVRQRGLLH